MPKESQRFIGKLNAPSYPILQGCMQTQHGSRGCPIDTNPLISIQQREGGLPINPGIRRIQRIGIDKKLRKVRRRLCGSRQLQQEEKRGSDACGSKQVPGHGCEVLSCDCMKRERTQICLVTKEGA